MLDGKRIVVVTPAGRRRYMAILMRHVLRLRPVVDEYRVWVNTARPRDVAYLESLPTQYPGFVTIERLPHGVDVLGNLSIHHFFRNCVDPDTVYVRFDDDIVCIDSADAFEDFVRYRIAHPEPLLVYANILNNAIVSYIHQKAGTLSLKDYELAYHCTESPGWKIPECAHALHEEVLQVLEPKNTLQSFRLPGFNPTFEGYERVSINCISWLGADFASFHGEVGPDEELWLSCTKPAESGRPNAMYGGFVVVHFAFHTQRLHLELSPDSDVLQRYAALVGISEVGDPEDDEVQVAPPPQIVHRRRMMGIDPAPSVAPTVPPWELPGYALPDNMLELLNVYKTNNGAT